jgi:hypothetical protein
MQEIKGLLSQMNSGMALNVDSGSKYPEIFGIVY